MHQQQDGVPNLKKKTRSSRKAQMSSMISSNIKLMVLKCYKDLEEKPIIQWCYQFHVPIEPVHRKAAPFDYIAINQAFTAIVRGLTLLGRVYDPKNMSVEEAPRKAKGR